MKSAKHYLMLWIILFLSFLPSVVSAQTITVKGLVKDATGEPIIGANVIDVNTKKGTIADLNGVFSITVAPNAQLRVSFVGYQQQIVAVKGRKQIDRKSTRLNSS